MITGIIPVLSIFLWFLNHETGFKKEGNPFQAWLFTYPLMSLMNIVFYTAFLHRLVQKFKNRDVVKKGTSKAVKIHS